MSPDACGRRSTSASTSSRTARIASARGCPASAASHSAARRSRPRAPRELALHSLHVYFLRAGADRPSPALLRVARVRDGRRFAHAPRRGARRRQALLRADSRASPRRAAVSSTRSRRRAARARAGGSCRTRREIERRRAGAEAAGPLGGALEWRFVGGRPWQPAATSRLPRLGAAAHAAADGARAARRRARLPGRHALAPAGGAPARRALRALRLHEPGSGAVGAPRRAVDGLAPADQRLATSRTAGAPSRAARCTRATAA